MGKDAHQPVGHTQVIYPNLLEDKLDRLVDGPQFLLFVRYDRRRRPRLDFSVCGTRLRQEV
jgi:hypothetical protein